MIGDGKVSLGKTWSHVPHCRLLISHPKDQESNVRELVLIKSSRLVNKKKILHLFAGMLKFFEYKYFYGYMTLQQE